MRGLQNKRMIITGGAQGIGRQPVFQKPGVRGLATPEFTG